MRLAILLLLTLACWAQEEDPSPQLLGVKRVFVDRLTGGETAAQMRDLIISALQGSKFFVVTENAERADAFLRGAAEDLVYTDTFQSSERASGRTTITSRGSGATRQPGFGTSGSDAESVNIHERKHEALATVRIVNKDGDVLWSTTQESGGAKFRGASADVADKIAKALGQELDRLRKLPKSSR